MSPNPSNPGNNNPSQPSYDPKKEDDQRQNPKEAQPGKRDDEWKSPNSR
jgi:hypothetical protein